MAKFRNNNIEMLPGKTVDGRDVSEDGKKLDNATSQGVPNTLVSRDNTNHTNVISSQTQRLEIPREILFVGDITGSYIFDGSEDIQTHITVKDNSHHHDLQYYTKSEMDATIGTLSVGDHKHAILRNGDGLKYFNYTGELNVTINVNWEGFGDDWGVSSQFCARSDHKHDILYYPREEARDTFASSIDISGDNIRLKDDLGNIHSSIQAPWALRLGAISGGSGLSLNSTTLNNEINKVVRTDNNGHVRFGWINTVSGSTTNNLTHVYVDTGDNFIRKCSLSHLLIQANITGNDVNNHYHTRLYSTSHTSQYYLTNEFDGNRWLLKNNHGGETRVNYADMAGHAIQAQYADLAEIYFLSNPDLLDGTLLTISETSDYELEECLTDKAFVIGVISQNPGFTLNSNDAGKPNALPVALVGKNPIRVIGSVKKGDALVPAGNGCAKVYSDFSESPFIFAYSQETNINQKEKLVNSILK